MKCAVIYLVIYLALTVLKVGCFGAESVKTMNLAEANPTELAVFGGGCFWCMEAVFEELPGVIAVTSGYAGGHVANPTYQQVCTGKTGHAEVVQIEFNPRIISYEKLLAVFWDVHDPTTPNRQGPDVGTQYRSIIFYCDEAQRQAAETSKADAQKRFANRVVTEIVPLKHFYRAEEYHQDYFRKNPDNAYCRINIPPKLEKLRRHKSSKLKSEMPN